MTEPKTMRRRRRSNAARADAVPAYVAEWFAAGCPERTTPWAIPLPLFVDGVLQPDPGPAWWAAWTKDHPGAMAPAALRYLLEGQPG